LLVRPVFTESEAKLEAMPAAEPDDLALAIVQTVQAGARIVNLSVGIPSTSSHVNSDLNRALDFAARHGALVIAAAGNQSFVGTTEITQHSWVIPVVSCDLNGRLTQESNLSASTGRRGLIAPGRGLSVRSSDGCLVPLQGTSIATPFVSGTAALLMSLYPDVPVACVRHALLVGVMARRRSIVPPLLNAMLAHQIMRQFSN
jgi:subtilisin family serine protease